MTTSDNSQNEFDFAQHKLKAVADYQKVKALYEEFALVVKNILAESLNESNILVHSIEARAKDLNSFGKKASKRSLDNPNKPKYLNPLVEITDLAGLRVITFFPKTQDSVSKSILAQFEIIEKSDKSEILIKEEKFGYASIHYLIRLTDDRTKLLEYKRFKNLIAEIQVRTILQHAWAEIEHDIQYKSIDTIPVEIHRRFMSLAGMLEIADREFQTIQDDDFKLRKNARLSVSKGKFENVELTPDALKAFLDRKLGSDGRMTDFSYEFQTRILKKLGFSNFKEINECIKGFNADKLNKILWPSKQGQLSRFEYLLLASMGEYYIKYHPWSKEQWYIDMCQRDLEKFIKAEIKIKKYLPLSKKKAE
jgi:ppGpp synthetase/RelA/SpoT-type nucleotidyltranferase